MFSSLSLDDNILLYESNLILVQNIETFYYYFAFKRFSWDGLLIGKVYQKHFKGQMNARKQ